MTLETLLFLRRCLGTLQLHVGDPAFRVAARQAIDALDELDAAIAAVQGQPEGER